MQLQYQTARLSSSLRSRTSRAAGGPLANLRVGQKLALIAFSFGIPLSVLLSLVLQQGQQDIRLLQQQESGVTHVALAQDVLAKLQQHRRLMDNALTGVGSLQAAQAKAREIDAALQKAVAAARQNGDPFGELDDYAQLERAWNTIKARGINTTAAQSFEAHEQAIDESMLPLLTEIANESKLILDPNLDSFYLVLASTRQLPQLLESIGELRHEGQTALNRSQLDVATRVRVAGLIEKVQEENEIANQSLTYAAQANSAFAAQLKAVDDKANLSLKTLLTTARDEIVNQPKSALSAATFSQLATRVNEEYRKLFAVSFNDLDVTFAQRRQEIERTRLLTLLGVGAVVLAAFALLIALARSITKPLGALTRASQALGQGDLDVKVPVRTRDELGFMANTFNRTAAQLRENELKNQREREESQRLQQNIGDFLDVTMDIADGDLTRRGRVSEDVLGNVVDSINLMVEELGTVLRGVQAASSSVSGGAQAMLGTTGEIVQGSEATAGEAQRVREQVQEVTGAIRRMAEIAAASATAAQQALSASVQGQDAVKDTLGGMQNVRREVQDISKRVKALGDRSLEIQEIVDTITRLSSQTNLLALNAAIEAAGAGEAGSRFAIVADEVRKLAENSAQATGRIATLIKTVQGEIQEVVASVEDGTREVESGYRVATTAGERLQELGALARQSAQLAESISAATTEQVRGVEQVGEAVGEIAQIAERSSVSVQRGRQAAEELQALAGQLGGSLERFRLPG
ncbi:methyl-accepting chemotaxis protein [Deinococcus planocerae]|uniref:methyl-accepting chemotaxis protein n=1 Tax=Deinococcus planocerae TaxID=1737569 RepID=UPI0015E14DD3|nr:methyl-accepting chemotaxis protein [Deinococcus planocerae]